MVRPSNDSHRAGDQQSSQITLTHLRSAPQPLFAARGMLSGRQRHPSCEIAALRNGLGWRHECHHRRSAEPEILRGATGILNCFEYVAVDAGFERGRMQETTAPEVIQFLFAHGFELVDLNPKRVTFLFRRSHRSTN